MVDSTGSGLASVIFGAATNNADYVIKSGHHVTFDWDTYGLANGIGLVVEAGAILDFKADIVTYLKPKANIDINGAFYVANRATVSDFTATENRTNVYQAARTLATYSVEETLGVPYLAAYNEVMEDAIIAENARLRGLDEAEMMADEVITFIETTRASLTLGDYLDYVEANPGSYYHDSTNNLLYIHTSDSTNPSGKTITGIEPINRPTEGTENRCQIIWGSSGGITSTVTGEALIITYGWAPERKHDKILSDVALNATEIPLTVGLTVQQGDKVKIGCYNTLGALTEASTGLYTVSSYNAETKVITLSSGIQTARKAGDYIAIASSPIKIGRSSGTTTLQETGLNMDVKCQGTYFGVGLQYNGHATGTQLVPFPSNFEFRDCIFYAGTIFYVNQSTITDSVIIKSYCAAYCPNLTVKRTIAISGRVAYLNYGDCHYDEVIAQNTWDIPGQGSIKNSVFKRIAGFCYASDVVHAKNCIFDCDESSVHTMESDITSVFTDCTFKDGFKGFRIHNHKLYNCIFENDNVTVLYNDAEANPRKTIESIDHNQIQGNYLAWMLGGTIETLFTNEVVQPGHLIFKPESEDYPVFRDYPITVQEGRIHQYRVGMKKDFTGGTVKAEIIDPSADPLIDTTAPALKTVNMPDMVNSKRTISISYKATQNKQLILRVSAINSSGNVYIDPPFDRFRKYRLQ